MQGGLLYAGSDIRIKQNIEGISDEFINKLFTLDNVTYEFDFKGSNNHSVGFIAQWLNEYAPEAVNYDAENDFYSVNYDAALSKILGALFKKVKQQQEEIDKIKQLLY